jgi:predicted permease
LFKPIHGVAEPERLVEVSRTYEGRGFSDCSYPDYLDYRNQNTVMTGLAVNKSTSFNLNTGRITERVEGEQVSGNYFDVLGVRPVRGRLLSPADSSENGGNMVAVISFGLWRRNFNADPDVVGKTIKLNSYEYMVVGVTDEEFEGIKAGFKMDIWVPIMTLSQTNRSGTWLEMFGRLKPGVSIERANAEFSTIARQLEQAYPQTNAKAGARVDPDLGMDPELRTKIRQFTFIPFVAVGLVLLIACVNVAGLLLARANAREREIGTRLALGASRARIIRQLLTESLILALLGGISGLLAGSWMTRWLVNILPNNFREISFKFDFGVDWRVFAFTLAASVLTGALFGMVPAIRASKTDLVTALKDARSTGRRRSGLRGTMVVTQVALSFVLLIAAGLCLRTLYNARTMDLVLCKLSFLM